MGKVFTFEDIQEGRIPDSDNFKIAKTTVVDRLSAIHAKGMIEGAMVFGSVAKGTPNLRSDFDLLVVTNSDTVDPLIKSTFDEVYASTNVAIEPIIIPLEYARCGWHSLDRSFYSHFAQLPEQGNVVGTHPLRMISPSDKPLSEAHKEYLIQKLRRLREGVFTYSWNDKLKVLQRALEAPVNTGRRTLRTLSAVGQLDTDLVDDGKASVIREFRTTFSSSSLMDGFNTLLSKDARYTDLLTEALTGQINESQYNSAVNKLSNEAIPLAIFWVNEVSHFYMQALEGNPLHPEGNPYSGNKERS
jgi:hypothetical protein